MFTCTFENNFFVLQRYYHYITTGIPDNALLDLDPNIMEKIVKSRVPLTLRDSPIAEAIVNQLKQEVQTDYNFSLRKAIGESF